LIKPRRTLLATLFAPLYYLVQLLPIFVEDFFVGFILQSRFGSWRLLYSFWRGRGAFRIPTKQADYVVQIKPEQKGEAPDKERRQNEEKNESKPTLFFSSSLLSHVG
jgi:hypothetical protein